MACRDGKACDDASGRCVDPSCPASCTTGTTCREGACVDACDGAICPPGQLCEAGACRLPRRGEEVPPPPPPGARPDGGAPGTDGSTPRSDGGLGAGPMEGEASCTCRAAGAGTSGRRALLVVGAWALAVVALRIGRRRARYLSRSSDAKVR
ncbi:MAG: hypothetical protein IT379_11370 [Deltaproteobacteria bacterium]|nr:hypothetical protein [Deltaproteobacteria bacterium]